MAKVTVCGQTREYPEGTALSVVAGDFQDNYKNRIAVAVVNGKIKELFKRVSSDAEVSFLTLKDSVGHKAYARSAIMLMLKSFEDVVVDVEADVDVT